MTDSNVLLENLTSSDSLDSSPNQNINPSVYFSAQPLSRQNSANNLTLYEIRKSKRGAQNNYNMSQTGTIKTATYVSPNGTLSKINIISNENEPVANTATLIKQQQLNGLANTRNLSNLIGLQHAQPNDYCASGRIGALLANNSNTNSLSRNHYLIPCNSTLNDQAWVIKNFFNFFFH
jgi:hypothetical protein